MLNKRHFEEVNWQLAVVAKQIVSLSNALDSISFCHMVREWNKVANGLARWASEKMETWNVDDWGNLPSDLTPILEDWVMEDMRSFWGAT